MAEFTTELNPNTSEAVVLRGGSYYVDYGSAGNRYDDNSGSAHSNYGARATLFIK